MDERYFTGVNAAIVGGGDACSPRPSAAHGLHQIAERLQP